MYKNYSVLFVDDEVNILSSLKRGLIDEEYNCFFASTGKEALEILDQQKISVIVSDMRMPEMDGLHLLKEVKERWPQTVRIVLSGYTQLQQILTTINQVDVFKFITKPWKLEEEFKDVIYKALDFYILIEENEKNKIALNNKNIAYQNILKNIDTTISNAKRSSKILAACGRSLLAYKKCANNSLNEKIIMYKEEIYEYFSNAVLGDEKDYSIDKLEEEFTDFIKSKIKVSKIESKINTKQKVKLNPAILEAMILSSLTVFNEEFLASGVYLSYSISKNNNLVLSMISLNAHSLNKIVIDNGQTALDCKIDFLNTVFSNLLTLCNLGFSAMKSNESLIISISLQKYRSM